MLNTQEPHKRLRSVIRSEHWNSLVEVLEERRAQCIQSLVKCEPEELKKIQGSVQELDYLLGLKARLIAEESSRKS